MYQEKRTVSHLRDFGESKIVALVPYLAHATLEKTHQVIQKPTFMMILCISQLCGCAWNHYDGHTQVIWPEPIEEFLKSDIGKYILNSDISKGIFGAIVVLFVLWLLDGIGGGGGKGNPRSDPGNSNRSMWR